MIPTVHYSQTELLEGIMELYAPTGFSLDPTFSKGAFYKDGRVPVPAFCYDLVPRHPRASACDVRSLPQTDCSMASAIFDPPFLHAHGKASKMGNRFGSYPSQKALHQFYREALVELRRVLIPGGILVFKCQDTVESGRQVWSHILIYEAALALGFKALDLFILAARGRMVGHNHGRQVHARKFHSYFWIFERGNRP